MRLASSMRASQLRQLVQPVATQSQLKLEATQPLHGYTHAHVGCAVVRSEAFRACQLVQGGRLRRRLTQALGELDKGTL